MRRLVRPSGRSSRPGRTPLLLAGIAAPLLGLVLWLFTTDRAPSSLASSAPSAAAPERGLRSDAAPLSPSTTPLRVHLPSAPPLASGRVLDQFGAPVCGAEVGLHRTSNDAPRERDPVLAGLHWDPWSSKRTVPDVLTDAEGRFAFAGTRKDSELKVAVRGTEHWWSVSSEPLRLEDGRVPEPVELRIERLGAIAVELLLVPGPTRARGMAEATLSIPALERPADRAHEGAKRPSPSTHVTGVQLARVDRFEDGVLECVPPGLHTVRIVSQNGLFTPRDVGPILVEAGGTTRDPRLLPVDLRDGQRRLSFDVLDPETGAVAGSRVQLRLRTEDWRSDWFDLEPQPLGKQDVRIGQGQVDARVTSSDHAVSVHPDVRDEAVVPLWPLHRRVVTLRPGGRPAPAEGRVRLRLVPSEVAAEPPADEHSDETPPQLRQIPGGGFLLGEQGSESLLSFASLRQSEPLDLFTPSPGPWVTLDPEADTVVLTSRFRGAHRVEARLLPPAEGASPIRLRAEPSQLDVGAPPAGHPAGDRSPTTPDPVSLSLSR